MIFLTSYIWDLDIFHPRGDDVREPTLHLCGEYQASVMGKRGLLGALGGFFCYNV